MHKGMSQVRIKSAELGQVEAVFSTFDVIDKDGDVTERTAFAEGQSVLISAYQHATWQGALPVGVGTIRTNEKEAMLDGQFFMNTDHGRNTFLTVKALAEQGKGEWSYGFDVVEAAPGVVDGQDVTILQKLDVHEVSPVLIGAGVNTRTLVAKSAGGAGSSATRGAPMDVGAFRVIKAHETACTKGSWSEAGVVEGIPDDAGIDDLRSVFAYCSGDPTQKSSYAFPHHDSVGGPANVRAILVGIARLNGAKGAGMPDADRKGVYDHLVGHLTDIEYDPMPELRSGQGGMKLHDELAAALVGVMDARESARRVVALRAQKKKALSRVNSDLLQWLHEETRELRAQVDTPSDDLAREFVRFIQNTQEPIQ